MLSILANRELGSASYHNITTLYIDQLRQRALGNRCILLSKLFDSTSDPRIQELEQKDIVSSIRFNLAQLLEHKHISDCDIEFYHSFYRRCTRYVASVDSTGWRLIVDLMDCFISVTCKPETNILLDTLDELYIHFLWVQM